jgi:4-aminobutyrate aminotransferase-like enzyme
MEPGATDTMTKSQAVMAGQREFIFPAVQPFYDDPLVLDEGEGVWVRDADGVEYLDLFSGILTTSVGHCNPHVVERSRAQMGRLGHTSTLYVTKPQVEAAERLAAIAPGRLSQTFFTNSGTEAIETAITMAFLHTGRSEVIALRQAYHGRSFLASNITAVDVWRPLATSFPGIKHALTPYPYRCPFKQPCDESCTEAFANDLEDVIRTTTNGRPAAFIAESIMGVGGYIVPPPGYFARAAEIIRSYGGLFISDEVQSGFGRSGKHWFAIEHSGVEPDIMVMAKGIANGAPVGATITRPDIAESWKAKTISTFGGSPVSMAAAAATLEVMVNEDVPSRAEERGSQLVKGLRELQGKHDWIGDVRGMGLMQALELVEDRDSKTPSPRHAKALMEAAKDERLLIGQGGVSGHVIRLGPSLLITEEEIREGLERFGRSCQGMEDAL